MVRINIPSKRTPLGRLLKVGYELTLEREITKDEQELLMSKNRVVIPTKKHLEEILNKGW